MISMTDLLDSVSLVLKTHIMSWMSSPREAKPKVPSYSGNGPVPTTEPYREAEKLFCGHVLWKLAMLAK